MFDAKDLSILGRRILEVVAPEVGEAHEARQLDQEEREAEAAASLRMIDDGYGTCHGRFTIPSLHGAMLKQALLGYAARHRASVDGQAPEPGRPSAHRLGEACVEYLETYPADRLPDTGGVSATVVVTITLESLMGGLKAARLDTGHRISPGLASRLACRAGIIPAVLGTRSQVLDPGRRAHDTPWHRGGATDPKTGRLLCPRHHARAHDPTCTTTRLPDGKVRFLRRT